VSPSDTSRLWIRHVRITTRAIQSQKDLRIRDTEESQDQLSEDETGNHDGQGMCDHSYTYYIGGSVYLLEMVPKIPLE
jgi:hypothetical protein